MPEEGKNKLSFQNHHKQLPVPFIIYADFEALTRKVEGPELDPSKSNTPEDAAARSVQLLLRGCPL